MLQWYAAETLPEDDDSVGPVESLGQPTGSHGKPVKPYLAPPPFPAQLTLRERIAQDVRISPEGTKSIYEPKRQEGTGVDDEELEYESYLLPINDAIERLGGQKYKSLASDVVRRGWEAVQLRIRMEDQRASV